MEPIVALLRKPTEFADEDEEGELHFSLDSNCEINLFNNRSEAVAWQTKAEARGWRGAWCLIDAWERRSNL